MSRSLLVLALTAAGAAAQTHAELSQVQTVYLMRMKSGFELHLANHLTNAGVFRVVTDPAKAEAVFSDRLGKGFEDELKVLYPPPPAPEPQKPVEETEGTGLPSIKPSERPRSAGFGTSAGTVFLVDRRSHQVLWSTFVRPKSYSTKDLDNSASDVVKRLQESLLGKKP